MTDDHGALGILRRLLERREQPVIELSLDSPLYTEGLNLDSLEVAELSAELEQAFGRDPFTDGELPKTVGEIVAYYENHRAR